jgi:hypothetical protein
MADNPKNDLPKMPPFRIVDGSGKEVKPSNGAPPPPKPPDKMNDPYPSPRRLLSVMILMVSILSVGIAMAGGAWIAVDALAKGLDNQVGVFPKIVAVGMAYIIGWLVTVFGVRVAGHLILPFIVKAYAWMTLAGICILQIAIISKLFNQSYSVFKFTIYLMMMGTGLLALIGFHLIVEKHNLALFSFPILTVSLVHLFVIVLHYVFVELDSEKYKYFWGDTIFFLFTTATGILMLAHFGILNGMRRLIDHKFSPKDNPFVPPD